MRILWIIPCRRGESLDMLFARRGWEDMGKHGFDVIMHDFNQRRSLMGFLAEVIRLRNRCREERIDLVHAQFGSTTALLALFSGRRYVVTFRGTDLNGDPASGRIANAARRLAGVVGAHFAAGVVVVARPLLAKLIGFPSVTLVQPSGTRTDAFYPMDQEKCRSELSMATTRYLAFGPGAPDGGRKVKRLDLAEQVVQRLKRMGHDVDLQLIWDIQPSRVPCVMNACDVVLLTSEKEGSPNIVREGLACGVPVVAFPVGDAADWMALDPRSCVVPMGDIDGMTQAVDELLRDPPPRERRVDVSLYSVEIQVSRLVGFYRRVLGTEGIVHGT